MIGGPRRRWRVLASLLVAAPLQGQTPPWRLLRESGFTIPSTIANANSIALLPNGHLLLRDNRPPYIHIIDRTGRSIRAFVEHGAGPGHATNPVRIGYLNGQVWLWDTATERLSYFTLEGVLQRELPLAIHGDVIPRAANRFVVLPFFVYSPGGDSMRTITINAIDSTGRLKERLFSYTGAIPTLTVPAGGGRTTVGGQPYFQVPYQAVFPHGNGLAVAFPAVMRRGTRTAFRLVRMDEAGKRLFDGWVDVPGVRTGPRQLDEAVAYLTSGPAAKDPAYAGRVRKAVRVPAFLPAFTVAMVGPGGETWLRDFALGRGGPGWFVVSATGSLLGRVTLGRDEQLASITPDGRLVVRGEGADGEPTLTFYRVDRR
ncbi:MAG: hypothetical protein IPJ11_14170 [Gemmatimonadetes bacterium]|nr:hypothetical protein [Gemmatimonadota bacterium]